MIKHFLDEDRVRKTVDSLQTIKDLSQYIESEHIKGIYFYDL